MNYVLQILLIIALIIVGAVARKRNIVSETGTSEMAHLLISIIYPALIFYSITRLQPSDLLHNWTMPLLAIAIAGVGLGTGCLALKYLKGVDQKRAGAFLFQSTINNYLFLPLPLVMLLWGTPGVALLIFASVGFEVTIWTVGVFLFNRNNRQADPLKSIFSPPLVTLLVSIAWILIREISPIQIPEGSILIRITELLYFGCEAIGKATVALSMIIAGSRLAVMPLKAVSDPHVWVLSILRLVVAPVLFLLMLRLVPMDELARNVLTMIAVMPAAVSSLIFSERFNGDTEFIAATLLVTHVVAVITVPALLIWAL